MDQNCVSCNGQTHLCKEQICDEKYLSSAVDEVDGEVVVGVGRVVVDPELPGDGGEDGGGQQHAPGDEGLLHEGEKVGEEGEESEEEADISKTRVRLEHTGQPNQSGC